MYSILLIIHHSIVQVPTSGCIVINGLVEEKVWSDSTRVLLVHTMVLFLNQNSECFFLAIEFLDSPGILVLISIYGLNPEPEYCMFHPFSGIKY